MSEQVLAELCTRLEATLADWQTQAMAAHEGLGERLAKLREQMDGLVADLVARGQASVSLGKTIASEGRSLIQELRTCAESGAEERRRIGGLEKRLSEETDAAQVARQRVVHLEKTLEKREQAATEMTQRAMRLEKSAAEINEAAQAAKRRIAELEANLRERNQAAEAAGKRVAELQETESAVRKELEAVRRQAHENRAAADDLKTARAELDSLRAELNGLRAAAEKAGKMGSLLETERARADEMAERLKHETANGSKAVIGQQLAQALQDAEQAHAELAVLRNELKTLRNLGRGPSGSAEGAALMDSSMIRRAARLREAQKYSLGEILLNAGILDQSQLDRALEQQKKTPDRSLSEILVGEGYASEEVVAQALASQNGVLFVRLNERTVDPAAAKLISGRVAAQHSCIPIKTVGDALVLAMANPLDLVAIQDVEHASGKAVRPVVGLRSEIAHTLERVYREG